MTPIAAVIWALALGLVIILIAVGVGVGIVIVRSALASKVGPKAVGK